MLSIFKYHQVYFFLILLVSIGIGLQVIIYKIAIFGLLLQWLIGQNYKDKILQLTSNRFAVGLIAFFVLYTISFFWSENKDIAIIDIILKTPILVLPFIILSQDALSVKQKNQVFLSFSLASLFLNLYCLADAYFLYIETYSINEFYYHNLTVNTHTSAQSMFTCLSIVFFGYLYLKEKFISSWTAYLLIIIQMIFILLLSSRMQILIMAVIVPIYFISYYYKKNLALGMLYTLLIFFAAYFFISLPSSSLNHRYKKTISGSSDPRELIWLRGLDVIKKNWFIGAGTGDAKDLLMGQYSDFILEEPISDHLIDSTVILLQDNKKQIYLQGESIDSSFDYKAMREYANNILMEANANNKQAFALEYNFHNQYLQTFAEIGILGLLLLSYLLCYAFIFSMRNKDYLCILFLFIVAVSFLTESMLERQAGVSFFAFFYALLVGGAIQNKPS